jgi:hypothetical protein
MTAGFTFRSRFLAGARIKRMGIFKEKTPGNLSDPIAFEPVVRAGAAQVLGFTREAGAKRDIRILKRLNDIMAAMSGG